MGRSTVARCVTLSDMTAARQFSARLDAEVVDRLERRAAQSGLNKSRLAGLAAGPDVWEAIGALRATGLDGDEAIDTTAEWAGLTVRQVRDAVGYYSEYPSEIEERMRRNEEGADAAERRWRDQSLTR
jgi:hypothetical protein